MSCRKATRELLQRLRFGEQLDAQSAPHLEHLRTCAACREEVGLDRALVVELQRALRARVEGFAPPETAWDGVRQRALAESGPRWMAWFSRISTGLRAAGAVAAVALVLVLSAQGGSGDDQVANFQLRATGRGEVARADAMPSDPPPHEEEEPAPFYQTPAPLPPPASGRMSVIMTYSPTGEGLATVLPPPRPVSGLLR